MDRCVTLSILVALLIACGTSPPPSSATSVAPPSSAPPSSAPPTSVAPSRDAPFALHEWGVLDVDAHGRGHVSTGPERRVVTYHHPDFAEARAPVIYVHVLDGGAESHFDLAVTLPNGSFVEHYPRTTIDDTTLRWRRVVAHACPPPPPPSEPPIEATEGAPPEPDSRAMPAQARLTCGTADGVCEQFELARYASADAACLDVETLPPPADDPLAALAGLDLFGGSNVLFYRASTRPTLPLTIARVPSGAVRVRAATAVDGAIGGVMRLTLSGTDVLIARAPMPAANETVELPRPTEHVVRDAAIAQLRTELLQHGLSSGEAHAFLEAWECELFGVVDVAAPGDRAVLHPLTDAVVYFLSPAAIDAVATLSATPPARELHRAMLVRVDVGGSR
jgi:hypothetical protein